MTNITVTCNLRVVPDMESAKVEGMTPEQVSSELMAMLEKLELTDKLYNGYTWPGNGMELEVPESNSAPDFTTLVSMVNGWLAGYATDYSEYYEEPEPEFTVPEGSPNDVKLLLYYYSDTTERWCSYGFQVLDGKDEPWVMHGTEFEDFTAAVEVGLKYRMK